jgi:hypothetical protein
MDRPPVRDPHGTPIPGTGDPPVLRADQIQDALAALPGRQADHRGLVRAVPVSRDSREALREGLADVAPDHARMTLEDDGQGLLIRLGGTAGAVSPADVETAARIDTVLSGSGTDRGTANT